VRSLDVVRLAAYGADLQTLQRSPDRLAACEAMLGRLEPRGESGLKAAWDALRRDMRGSGPIVVFSSMEGDASAVQAVADMKGRHHPVTVFSPEPVGPSWEGDEPRRAARQAILASLRGLGAVVVDWAPGAPVVAERPVREEAFA
jgi:hypothetical protein